MSVSQFPGAMSIEMPLLLKWQRTEIEMQTQHCDSANRDYIMMSVINIEYLTPVTQYAMLSMFYNSCESSFELRIF